MGDLPLTNLLYDLRPLSLVCGSQLAIHYDWSTYGLVW